MRETSFIKQNKDKWDAFEKLSAKSKKDPDELSRYFVELTDDLSYSRTFYPNRSVRIYLNGISRKAFQNIYKNKKHFVWNKFIGFWRNHLPLALYQARFELYIATAIFIITVAIGCISTHYDKDFAKYILGADYIQLTEANIAKGDPMGIYKNDNTFEMFFRIAFNNLRIDFLMFVLGALFSIGTIAITMYNGIMLGTFQYFFYLKGLLITTALTIWLHGTLEMSAMVIVAGAGITMGRGLLFPGSYTRLHAFQLSALRGIKIFIAVLPCTFIAAIIETWVTRHTETSVWLKILLISGSIIFVVGYFYILPIYKKRRGHFEGMESTFHIPPDNIRVPVVDKFNSNDEIFRDIFWMIRNNFSRIFKSSTVISLVFTISSILMFKEKLMALNNVNIIDYFFRLLNVKITSYMAVPLLLLFGCIFFISYLSVRNFLKVEKIQIKEYIKIGSSVVFLAICFILPFQFSFAIGMLSFSLLFPSLVFIFMSWVATDDGIIKGIANAFQNTFTDFWKFIGMHIMIYLVAIFIYFLSSSSLSLLFLNIITDQLPVDPFTSDIILMCLDLFISAFIIAVIMNLWIYNGVLLFFSMRELVTSEHLKERISLLGTNRKRI